MPLTMTEPLETKLTLIVAVAVLRRARGTAGVGVGVGVGVVPLGAGVGLPGHAGTLSTAGMRCAAANVPSDWL